MSSKYLYLIPLSLIEVILQLAFFWLAPDVPCYWIVYAFGSVLTLVHIIVAFVVGSTYGVRISAATIVAGSICQILLIVTCCILLVSGSSIRNAVFSLMIASILYIVIVTLLILSIENAEMLDQCIVSPFYGRTDSDHGGIDNREVNSINEAQNAIDVRKLASRTSSPGGDDINLTCNIVPPPLPVRR